VLTYGDEFQAMLASKLTSNDYVNAIVTLCLKSRLCPKWWAEHESDIADLLGMATVDRAADPWAEAVVQIMPTTLRDSVYEFWCNEQLGWRSAVGGEVEDVEPPTLGED
jgi:hypothetical protein